MPQQDESWNLTPLILDFVGWVSAEPRAYADVMEAWRTSCPRLTVWEDCIERGLVERRHDPRAGQLIIPTAEGLALLAREGRRPGSPAGLGAAAP